MLMLKSWFIREHHTYKSVRFLRIEIPEGIGPLKPLPCMILKNMFWIRRHYVKKLKQLKFIKEKGKKI